MGSEPLKQYFNVLADATEGTNVLPLPDKKITYGIYNVAYRGKYKYIFNYIVIKITFLNIVMRNFNRKMVLLCLFINFV